MEKRIDDKKVKIAQILVALAEYYDVELNKMRLSMYVEDLKCLDVHTLLKCTRAYRRDPCNTRYPLPAKLIEIARNESEKGTHAIDPIDEAKVAASNIISCVSSFGYSNPREAKEYMGGLAWEVVEKNGGWYSVCTKMSNESVGMHQAQYRELALSILRRNARGIDGPPELPKSLRKRIAPETIGHDNENKEHQHSKLRFTEFNNLTKKLPQGEDKKISGASPNTGISSSGAAVGGLK